jgi:hypothetical protein
MDHSTISDIAVLLGALAPVLVALTPLLGELRRWRKK